MALPHAAYARSGASRFAASWEELDQEKPGRYVAGVLAQSLRGTALEPQLRIALPTRGHGLVRLADGTVLLAARRPGDWLLRFDPQGKRMPKWYWQDGVRVFTGHMLLHPNGKQVFTTETDTASGAGMLVLRDARSLKVLNSWPTGGIDPHALVWHGQDAVLVANGGIATQAQTGRAKLQLARMDSSLVRLQATTGALLGQWRLPDARLSIRHLTWSVAQGNRQPLLGLALQAEHDEMAQRHAAPVLATFDGAALHVKAGTTALQGYGGDIAALHTPHGAWAVSCPRAGVIAVFDHTAQLQSTLALPQACALIAHQGAAWAAGQGTALHMTHRNTTAALPTSLRLDNHWIVL